MSPLIPTRKRCTSETPFSPELAVTAARPRESGRRHPGSLHGTGEETHGRDTEERDVLAIDRYEVAGHEVRTPEQTRNPGGSPARIGTTTPFTNSSATMKFAFEDAGSMTCPVKL